MVSPRPEPVARSTENKQSLSTLVKGNEVKSSRAAGRPKGSKNKAKALITNEMAKTLLLTLEGKVSDDDYEYLKSVVVEGKAVLAEREAKMMLAMLRANLFPVMLEEMQGEQIKDPDGNVLSTTHKFRSDVTDRLKVWISLLNTVAGIERKNDKGTDTTEKPVLEVYARRGIDAGRLKVLIGYESGSLGGDTNGTGRGASETGTISDKLLERQIDLSDSEQESSVGLLDDVVSGDYTFSDGEEEL